MRWLDPNVPQNIERVGSDDKCTETSAGHNEDGRRSEYYDYRNEKDNS